MSVSENEMKEFFQRIVDQVAELSTQASQVEGLRNQIASLNDRLNHVEQINRELSAQVSETVSKLSQTQDMLNTTQNMLDSERAVAQSLRDTIVARDAGVVQLENSFRTEQEAHKITTSERDDARQKVQEQATELESFTNRLRDLTEDRDTWRKLATDHEREVSHLKSQLESINKVLNPLRVVSSDLGVA